MACPSTVCRPASAPRCDAIQGRYVLTERNSRADFLRRRPLVAGEDEGRNRSIGRSACTAHPGQRTRGTRMTESTQRNGIKAGDQP